MSITVNGRENEFIDVVTCYGRNGFFKLGQVEVDRCDNEVRVFLLSKRKGKGAPIMIHGSGKDIRYLFGSILDAMSIQPKAKLAKVKQRKVVLPHRSRPGFRGGSLPR